MGTQGSPDKPLGHCHRRNQEECSGDSAFRSGPRWTGKLDSSASLTHVGLPSPCHGPVQVSVHTTLDCEQSAMGVGRWCHVRLSLLRPEAFFLLLALLVACDTPSHPFQRTMFSRQRVNYLSHGGTETERRRDSRVLSDGFARCPQPGSSTQ